MNSTAFTVADYLLTRLKELGLTKIFQVPGDYVSNFMDALENFDGIDAVGAVYEMGAAYAADGYARVHGLCGVAAIWRGHLQCGQRHRRLVRRTRPGGGDFRQPVHQEP